MNDNDALPSAEPVRVEVEATVTIEPIAPAVVAGTVLADTVMGAVRVFAWVFVAAVAVTVVGVFIAAQLG
jgi:hypothetical protein